MKVPYNKHPEQYYEQLEAQGVDKVIGESIPTNVREEYIRDWRAKQNNKIVITKGYDLYKLRLDEFKGATKDQEDEYK